MDNQFINEVGCTFPIYTKKSINQHCKINSTIKALYGKFAQKTFTEICPKPCAKMDVTFSSNTIDKNANEEEAAVRFYYHLQVSVRRAVLRYTQLSLLAEVGGYIGLLLGVSLMDTARIFSWIVEKIQLSF